VEVGFVSDNGGGF